MSIEQPRQLSSDPPAVNDSVGAAHVESAAEPGLRCQWCSVPLTSGVTICPTCGSPGVPDPRFTKPEPERDASALLLEGVVDTSVIAPWRDDGLPSLDDPSPATRKQLTFQEVESRQLRTIMFAAASVLVCAFLGWLAGPLLSGVIESFTGTPVENTGDLRPMGAFFGLLTGFLISGIGGVVIWAGR